jgi:uncharacterized protein (UPF0335 family)
MSNGNGSSSAAGEQLLSLVERVEHLEAEIKDLNDDKRDIYQEAKGAGYDVKALKSVIAFRRKDASERAEQDAILETYMTAIQQAEIRRAGVGTDRATRASARDAGAGVAA